MSPVAGKARGQFEQLRNPADFAENRDKIAELDPQLARPLLQLRIGAKLAASAANMQISVLLDRSRPESLTTQMVDQICATPSAARRIGPGTRLPSSRRLSEQLAISRNTVVRAYDLLLMEGIVESRPASGMYVAEALPRDAAPVRPASERSAISRRATRMPMPLRHARAHAPAACRPQPAARTISFRAVPAPDLFPLKTWRRLLQNNLSHGGGAGLTQYGEPAGLPALRTAIANHLAAARGIVADPSRIVIVSGIQEGTYTRGAAVSGPRRAQRRRGSLLSGRRAGVRSRGRRSRLRRRSIGTDWFRTICRGAPPSLLYTTPSHQYPTGATLVGGAAHRGDRLGAAIRLLHHRGRLRLRYPLPGIASSAAGRAGARLHDLYRHVLQIARRRVAARLHGRARAYRRGRLRREIAAQQRQSLARAGDARRLHAQRQLCGPSASRPLALQG